MKRRPAFVEKAVVVGEDECPFCKGERKAEVWAEIVSKKTGEVMGRARMCRACLERKQDDRWFEWNEAGRFYIALEKAG